MIEVAEKVVQVKPAESVIERRDRSTAVESGDDGGLSARRIAFSMTPAFACHGPHGGVNSAPDDRYTTMPLPMARRFAALMSELANCGVESVVFTGGEPTLARQQLELMSLAAKAANLQVGIVTTAQWAATSRSAARTVARFPAIDFWDVMFERREAPWIGLSHVRHARSAVVAAGKSFSLRLADDAALSDADRRLLGLAQARPGASFGSRQAQAAGGPDAAAANPAGAERGAWFEPLSPQELIVRHDGSVAPCWLKTVSDPRVARWFPASH